MLCKYARICVYTYICTYMYVSMRVHMYVGTYVLHMNVCMYAWLGLSNYHDSTHYHNNLGLLTIMILDWLTI